MHNLAHLLDSGKLRAEKEDLVLVQAFRQRGLDNLESKEVRRLCRDTGSKRQNNLCVAFLTLFDQDCAKLGVEWQRGLEDLEKSRDCHRRLTSQHRSTSIKKVLGITYPIWTSGFRATLMPHTFTSSSNTSPSTLCPRGVVTTAWNLW